MTRVCISRTNSLGKIVFVVLMGLAGAHELGSVESANVVALGKSDFLSEALSPRPIETGEVPSSGSRLETLRADLARVEGELATDRPNKVDRPRYSQIKAKIDLSANSNAYHGEVIMAELLDLSAADRLQLNNLLGTNPPELLLGEDGAFYLIGNQKWGPAFLAKIYHRALPIETYQRMKTVALENGYEFDGGLPYLMIEIEFMELFNARMQSKDYSMLMDQLQGVLRQPVIFGPRKVGIVQRLDLRNLGGNIFSVSLVYADHPDDLPPEPPKTGGNIWKEAARVEKVLISPTSRIGVFLGGPHITGEYYYLLFAEVIRELFGESIDLVYLPFAVDPLSAVSSPLIHVLEQELLQNPLVVGAVVTRPWKAAFLKYAVDPIIGAVNYLVKTASGQLVGYAVDGDAWWAGLVHDLGHSPDLSDRIVVILGMGGAAKEIASGLKGKNVRHVVFSDPVSEMRGGMSKMLTALVPDFTWELLDSAQVDSVHKAVRQAFMVINATGIGRGNTAGKSPLSDSSSLKAVTIASDLISGVDTAFLQAARAEEVPHAFSGRSMFIFGMAHFIREWVRVIDSHLIGNDFSARAFHAIDKAA